MDVSIIICCYNSAKRIVTTLEYLAKLSLDDLKVELILVDNNCSDNTVSVAENEWSKLNSPFPLRVIREETPGLSNARMAGAKISTAELIVFCDDDNWLDSKYIVNATEIFKRSEKIGAIGGITKLVTNFEGDLPFFFQSNLHEYAVGAQYNREGILGDDKYYLWGAGLVINRSLFMKCFSSIPSLLKDRSGDSLSSGGDTEICARFLMLGYSLYYDPNLILFHWIDKSRIDNNYFQKLIKGHDESSVVISNYWTFLRYFNKGKLGFITRIVNNKIMLLKATIFLNRKNIHWYFQQIVFQLKWIFSIPFPLKKIFFIKRTLLK